MVMKERRGSLRSAVAVSSAWGEGGLEDGTGLVDPLADAVGSDADVDPPVPCAQAVTTTSSVAVSRSGTAAMSPR
jgi:hypothetical protein